MTNTEWFFGIVQKYRAGLNRINGKFDEQIESQKRYAGSAGFAEDTKKIEQTRGALQWVRYCEL